MSNSSVKEKVMLAGLRAIRSVPALNRIVYTASLNYIDEYRHFSYDPAVNGEQVIIKTIAKHNSKDPFVFFDVGANIGEWTSFCLSQFKQDMEGHLFELSSETYETLKDRLAGSNNLTLNNIGLSDKNANISYKNYGRDNGSNTIIMDADYHKKPYETCHASIIKGDEYCNEKHIHRINYLKVDTEGADYSVLLGFEKRFDAKSIDIVQFEYGYTHADAKTLMRDFFQFFEEHGYIVGRLSPRGVVFKNFEYTDNDFKSGPNYIACLPEYKVMLEKF